MRRTDRRDELAALLALPKVPLGEGCALIAAHLGHPVPLGATAASLDRLAAEVQPRSSAPIDLDDVAHHLFAVAGFAGDRTSYGDPRNSLLPEVIGRRRGIPITLAVVVIEVAARHGVRATGVGMPGHFLVGDGAEPRRWLDAFDGGTWLDERGARNVFAAIHGSEAGWDARWLAPTPAPQVVGRILTNLAVAHGRLGDPNARLRALELRAVVPGVGTTPRAQAELAEALAAVGRHAEAATVLEALEPRMDPRRRGALRARIDVLRAADN